MRCAEGPQRAARVSACAHALLATLRKRPAETMAVKRRCLARGKRRH
jgi:hypothetical protein